MERGDIIAFKPEIINKISNPELLRLDFVYEVVDVKKTRISIEDIYGNRQYILKKFYEYIVIINCD